MMYKDGKTKIIDLVICIQVNLYWTKLKSLEVEKVRVMTCNS